MNRILAPYWGRSFTSADTKMGSGCCVAWTGGHRGVSALRGSTAHDSERATRCGGERGDRGLRARLEAEGDERRRHRFAFLAPGRSGGDRRPVGKSVRRLKLRAAPLQAAQGGEMQAGPSASMLDREEDARTRQSRSSRQPGDETVGGSRETKAEL